MSESETGVNELRRHQLLILRLVALVFSVWVRTLRFSAADEVQAKINSLEGPLVIILWHNRLFAAKEYFRRWLFDRKQATLISASGDGAWLAAFLKMFGCLPIRGSRNNRSSQAVREMFKAYKQGYDILITPDGSKGPMYELKPGAVAVALKTGAPFVMFSMTHGKSWRLNSWDRFFIPMPFSKIEARVDVVEDPSSLGDSPEEVANQLQGRMNAITVD